MSETLGDWGKRNCDTGTLTPGSPDANAKNSVRSGDKAELSPDQTGNCCRALLQDALANTDHGPSLASQLP